MAGKRRRWRRQSKKTILGIVLTTAMLCGVLLYGTRSLLAKDDQYAAREKELEEQIQEQAQESEALSQEEEYIKTKEYVEEIAKTKLGLVYPDEILLKPNSEE